MNSSRNRIFYAAWIVVVILIGGASRLPITEGWPSFYREYGGDTFWSLMIFLGIGFLAPEWKTSSVAICTLTLAFGVEFSQLIQAEWMESLRNTLFGKLALGSGFKESDFICYSLGCGMGVAGEWIANAVSEKK